MFPHLTTSWGGCIFPGKARNGGPGQPVKLLWACSAWALPGAYSKRHKTPKTWSRQTVLSVHKISLARELLMARLRKRVERLWKWITALLLMLFLWFTAVSQISLNVSLGTLSSHSFLHKEVRGQAQHTRGWQGFILETFLAWFPGGDWEDSHIYKILLRLSSSSGTLTLFNLSDQCVMNVQQFCKKYPKVILE